MKRRRAACGPTAPTNLIVAPRGPSTGQAPAPDAPRAAWLAARNGRFTLGLSAGFFGMFAHAGVLAALESAGLRPGRIVGVSSGALAGAFTAAGRSSEELFDVLCDLRPEDFLDRRWKVGLAKGERLAATIEAALPPGAAGPLTIEELQVPFATVAYDLTAWKTRVIERGPVGLAIRASCAFPMLFEPVLIDGHRHTDGAVSDPTGRSALGADEAVLSHILPPRSILSPITGRMIPPQVEDAQRKVLRIDAIPAVTPGKLDEGRRAYAIARAGAREWLGM